MVDNCTMCDETYIKGTEHICKNHIWKIRRDYLPHIVVSRPFKTEDIDVMLQKAYDHNLKPVKWLIGNWMLDKIYMYYNARYLHFPKDCKATHLRGVEIEICKEDEYKIALLCEKKASNEL